MDKAGGREQGAGGTKVLGLFTFLHIVWFYCADLLTCSDPLLFWQLRGAGLVRSHGHTIIPRCQLYADYFREHLG
ncbi:hypothetical protein [Calothrix rhizosoleniae]|uniref:hypothetical protein n=1 Tax=Calothrix rhizosoleniae TaxID=888997 RepID=UPI001177CB02|nr:hypothetical protein [Calothrix rhizosoleniae]